jgi:hypothetical protein
MISVTMLESQWLMMDNTGNEILRERGKVKMTSPSFGSEMT